ncbi:unnamed protein product [Adineta steineri]|uniref:F-box domain-containing protein n=1 Tax=Adineta steineri TaxID=433720 RepID=A0A814JQ89_9BILA|nr:unnamed protein product [Adineta steineri]CAF1103850.1 unnamed protein product [Adineta steineri]
MANKIWFFDRLPVDLLYDIFDYFLAHDILLSFSNVSDRVDGVLRTYSFYRFDFKSISKDNFDLICRHIKPDQVISLVLSDASATPGQSELFLSRISIKQFTRLQSLTLYCIENETLELILLDLNKLDQLRSFHINSVTTKSPLRIYDYSPLINQVTPLLSKTLSQVLPKLHRLNIGQKFIATRTPLLVNLRSLALAQSTINELQMILIQTPHLRSLDVCLEGDTSNIELLDTPSQLKWLILTINGNYFLTNRY